MKRKSYKKLLFIIPLILTGCNKKTDPNKYNLSFKKGSDGYYISISKYNHTYKTINGSLGVRFDKNDYRLDNPIYKDYSSVKKIDDGLLAEGRVTSEYNSEIKFTDFFQIVGDRLLVNREFEVTKAGEDIAFSVDQKWIADEKGAIVDKNWFVPSCYYVNGDHTFFKSSSRSYFGGESFIASADDTSVCAVASLQNGFSFSMMDTTKGYRETSVIDLHSVDDSYLNISKDFNTPSIRVQNEDDKISISHIYPSFVSLRRDHIDYRALPIEKGLKRNISYQISLNEYSNFDEMYVNVWRKAFDHYKYADKRYSLANVRNVLLNYIKNSYASSNMWGEIPQYLTCADHYFPDSGFLYRNIEMATFMLEEGFKNNDQTQIANALTVINYQIDNDCIDLRMRAYNRDNSVFKRVLFDGLGSVVDLYELIKKSGYSNQALEEKLFSYIIKKADLYKNDDSLMAISFYSKIYKNKDLLFINYDDVALNLADKYIELTKEYYGYYGAIENSNLDLSCAEDYMILLHGLMNVYETNKNEKYLKECERISNYLETFNMIQPINMNPIGATGTEGYNFGFIGNERFLGYGYAFNNTNHHILDCPTVSTCSELYKLYKYTNNQHYLEFLEEKIYNSLLYVNMGDKIGHMDDPEHSSGDGYTNEFAGNSVATEGYADGGMRGAVHDSVLAWNIFELTYALNSLKDANYEGFNDDYSLVHDLAKNKVIEVENDNIRHPASNVIDEFDETYYVNSENSNLIFDLYEQCDISSIVIESQGEGSVKTSISSDKESFTEVNNLASVNKKARYVKFEVTSNFAIKKININGIPVKYVNLAVDSSVVDFDDSKLNAIDKSNYETYWNAGSSQESHVITLDLGEIHEIYQTSIMFGSSNAYQYDIEISNDGDNFILYGSDSGETAKYVFVNEGFATARFVRLTIKGSNESIIKVKDFKVLGC